MEKPKAISQEFRVSYGLRDLFKPPKEVVYKRMGEQLLLSLEGNTRAGLYPQHKNIEFPDPWSKHVSSDISKIKVVNEEAGLFAKIYSPRYKGYPEAAYEAMRKIAARHPVQGPEWLYTPEDPELSSGIMFFRLGTQARTISLANPSLIDSIGQIAREHNLTPFDAGKVAIIRDNNGRELIVDPLEDRHDVMLENMQRINSNNKPLSSRGNIIYLNFPQISK